MYPLDLSSHTMFFFSEKLTQRDILKVKLKSQPRISKHEGGLNELVVDFFILIVIIVSRDVKIISSRRLRDID